METENGVKSTCVCLLIDMILHRLYTWATVPITPRPASSMSPASLPRIRERLRRTSGWLARPGKRGIAAWLVGR